ncbi:MAG: hypothetical protein BGO31_00780 [Bacteroidetes bacterium 43-16]|nr:MAG: hypothetical protein BGO31_00780 [Bacteroidetes bacterium 43-16]
MGPSSILSPLMFTDVLSVQGLALRPKASPLTRVCLRIGVQENEVISIADEFCAFEEKLKCMQNSRIKNEYFFKG